MLATLISDAWHGISFGQSGFFASLAPTGYLELLQELKQHIRRAQIRAALAVNREMALLYWSIGRDILARQGREGWGAKIIERLAYDLQVEFPGIEGFSPRSLK